MSADTKMSLKFMTRRTAGAMEPLHGAICVDWGDKNEGTVFDHHSLREATCSAALVNSAEGWNRLRGAVAEASRSGSSVCVATHASPDLDSVAAACTVGRALKPDGTPLHAEVVQYVLAKDQGEEVGEDPANSLALLFQALKARCGENDAEVMRQGIALVDALNRAVCTRSFRLGWNDPCDLAGLPVDVKALQTDILDSRKRLRGILACAPRLLLSLPRRDGSTREFSWVDGCVLDFSQLKADPLGWKEHVRHDLHGSLQGNGFGFSAVVATKRGRDNFIVSIDPRAGVSLAGLGAQLEAAESRESERLMSKPDQWTERLQSVASARKVSGGRPSLLRDTTSPRPGYENSDPWYDGRGHGFTIVDTPESGTVMEREAVLNEALTVYDPLWREAVHKQSARLCIAQSNGDCANADPQWLAGTVCGWDGKVRPSSSASAAERDSVLADLLNALARIGAQHPFVVYAPLTACPSQLLPASTPHLHLHLALYLAMHGMPANAPDYPDMGRLERWVSEFTWRPLPGVWCAISERGAIMFDYVCADEGGEPQTFQRFRDDYLALVKQLDWTGTLSAAVRSVKRYEALRDFARRSGIE